MDRIVSGTYVGTGAAINISLGFIPGKLEVFNETDGDDQWTWIRGMTNGHAYQRVGAGTGTRITSNGVSEYAGVAGSAAVGVTVGSSLSESGKTFRYVAYRRD